MNKATIIGRLGRDPEIRYTASGTAVAEFSVATDEHWTDQNGEKKQKTEWHNIVAWSRLAEICAQYLKKGKLIYLEGRIRTRDWEKDGVKHYKTEIVASQMEMLGSKQEEEQEQIYAHPEDTPDTDLDIDSDSIPF